MIERRGGPENQRTGVNWASGNTIRNMAAERGDKFPLGNNPEKSIGTPKEHFTNWKNERIENIPLGPVPDFDKIDAERLHSLPSINKENAPALVQHLPAITQKVNETRTEFGLEPLPYNEANYKIVDPDEYDNNPTIQEKTSSSGAFYDQKTGLVVIKDIRDGDLRSNTIEQVYAGTHESVHEGQQGGIGKYSYALDEGIVDDDARTILKQTVFPHLLTPVDEANLGEYYTKQLAPSGIAIEGITVGKEDILYLPNEGNPKGYARIPEMYIANGMKEANPDAYHALRAEAYSGNPEGAKRVVEKAFGADIADALNVSRQESRGRREGIDYKGIGDAIRSKGR